MSREHLNNASNIASCISPASSGGYYPNTLESKVESLRMVVQSLVMYLQENKLLAVDDRIMEADK